MNPGHRPPDTEAATEDVRATTSDEPAKKQEVDTGPLGTDKGISPVVPESVIAQSFPAIIRLATLAFAAVMLGFLVLYPIFMGFDEQHQLDRIYEVTDGQLLPIPGQEPVNEAVSRSSAMLFQGYPFGQAPTWDQKPSLPRDQRPSLSQLGGLDDDPPGGYINQLSQHPPLYYWMLGAGMALIPGHDSIPVDQLVFWLRLINVLILLPLPFLFWRGTAHLTDDGPAARAAAFLPLIIPALPRIGATINNDNLAILAGTATLAALTAVLRGDLSSRRGWHVAVPLVIALWCKGTSLLLCPVVLVCYLIGWATVRGKFPVRAAIPVGIGAIVGLAWWVQNVFRYGTLQPNGFGDSYTQFGDPLRTPGTPFDAAVFWDFVWRNFPTRFWGQLGEPEPPYLQPWIMVTLTGLVLVGLLLAVVFARGVRLATAVLWLFGIGALALIIRDGLAYSQKYQGFTGLQARYAFPLLFGLLVPIVIGLGSVLRRRAVWLSPALLVLGIVTTVASFYLWINRMMLPTGTLLAPGSVRRALANITRFFPFPTAISVGMIMLIGTALATAVAGVTILTVRSIHSESGSTPEPSGTKGVSAGAERVSESVPPVTQGRQAGGQPGIGAEH